MPYRSFWISEDFVGVYERLKQILRREGKTVGEHLRDHIAGYVDVHDPGNPQARLTSYSDVGSVDIAVVEGRIREYFRFRAEVHGLDISFRAIIERCKQDVADVRAALALAQRVAEWLRNRGVRVWQ